MGKISQTLANRFRRSHKLAGQLCRQVKEETAPIAKDVSKEHTANVNLETVEYVE